MSSVAFGRRRRQVDETEVAADIHTVSIMDELNSLKTKLEWAVSRLEQEVELQSGGKWGNEEPS